jgi:S1-C subfamily serine protease
MLSGCLVDNVLVGGPACSLGIEKGDKIVAIDGRYAYTRGVIYICMRV